MIRNQDWRALIRYGANFFMLEKLAAVTGSSNLHIYAGMRGESLDDFMKTRNAPGALYSVAGRDSKASHGISKTETTTRATIAMASVPHLSSRAANFIMVMRERVGYCAIAGRHGAAEYRCSVVRPHRLTDAGMRRRHADFSGRNEASVPGSALRRKRRNLAARTSGRRNRNGHADG